MDSFLQKADRKTQRLFDTISRLAGKAIMDYDMIRKGDRVMIGVSGGKDSLTLLHVMLQRQRIAPVDFELLAVHVDSGIPGIRVKRLEDHFRKIGVPYHIERTDLFLDKDLADLNCFWCSWNRRKALFNLAAKTGFNRIALAHHLDDIAQTILLNQLFKGEVSAMCPRQDLFKGKVAIIRPLAYEHESKILEFARAVRLTRFEACRCPVSPDTQRAAIRKFLNKMEKVNPEVKLNLFKSLRNIKSEYLL